ncbi:MAG: CRISPR-associated helicase Cas3' [Bacillota bacterium]
MKSHLLNVSEMAARFAAPFGWSEAGRVIGLAHDIGKYSTEFQERLADDRAKVDHSTAGGQIVVNTYPRSIGQLLAYQILGHHSSLPNCGSSNGEDSCLLRRLAKSVPDYDAFRKEIQLPSSIGLPWGLIDHPEFAFFFLIRMLFSCLVDADRLDAERFCDLDKSLLRGTFPSLSALLTRLQDYMARFTSAAKDTPVNRERAHVLKCCREASQLPQGIFTLTVPTGGGKTLSSLEFAMRHAIKHRLKRVIYVIPFTSIIDQTAKKFREVLGADAVLEHHSNYAFGDEDLPRFSLASENWDAPVIVTTNVQFFESLYAARATQCRKLHNIAESVLILDEAQTIPDDVLLPCLAALEELVRHYRVTAVMCTATQPALDGRWPMGSTTREIIPDSERLYQSLRRVVVEYVGEMPDFLIAEQMKEEKHALAIVNTRKHAAALYRQLESDSRHFHLSARMYPAHREEKLGEIRRLLAMGEPCRVVSTQLMEAGVDVDFPVVWRAVAGIDAIAQAAGRCNREGKLTKGRTFVFEPECGLPRGWFERMASIGKRVLELIDDPLSPEAVKRFFTERFILDTGGLDRHGILGDVRNKGGELAFQFREIADMFQLIDDCSHSIVIPCDDNRDILREIETSKYPNLYSRKLQRYTVTVHPSEFAEYLNRGWLRSLQDMYYVLDYERGYSCELGLLTVDDEAQEPLLV